MEKRSSDLKAKVEAERRKKKAEPMWFYDEVDEQWHNFRRDSRQIEREYSELRVALRDAETTLRASPADEYLQARVKYLRKRLEDLEKQIPWISAEVPIEVLLWGVPHG
jgi:DNA-binding transcriptional regulator GbsR (MarR family)